MCISEYLPSDMYTNLYISNESLVNIGYSKEISQTHNLMSVERKSDEHGRSMQRTS